MDPTLFKTRTEFINRNHPSSERFGAVGIDIGYSGVKAFFTKGYCCFPFFAKETKKDIITIGNRSRSDIIYEDLEDHTVWKVGELAASSLKEEDIVDEEILYGRNRYYSKQFQVLARVGMAAALRHEPAKKRNDFYLETGLPPAYLKKDSEYLKDALSGTHHFRVTFGNSHPEDFHLSLPPDHIDVIHQPMGTLYSIATDPAGKPTQNAANFFQSDLLIFDAGFRTLDPFLIKNHHLDYYDTFDELGMKRILDETRERIYSEYNMDISLPAMQNALKTGEIKVYDRRTFSSDSKPFAAFLEDATKKVCEEALQAVSNLLFDSQYLVVTGGTGECWYPLIKEKLKGMNTMKVIPGTYGDSISSIYSNARGYYYYLLQRLAHK